MYFLGGQLHTEKKVIEAFAPLAQVIAKDALTLTINGVFTAPTYNNPIGAEALDKTNIETYLQAQKAHAEPWIIDLIRNAYALEYGLPCAEQSALNLILLITTDTSKGFKIYGTSDEAMRLKGGGGTLVSAIMKKIANKVTIYQGHPLVEISDTENSFNLSFNKQGGAVKIKADRVIMALPFSVLRDVKGILELNLLQQKKWAIQEQGYGANSKLMLGFNSKFWREQQTTKTPASTGSLFTDFAAEEFWDTTRLQRGPEGILTHYQGADRDNVPTKDRIANAIKHISGVWPQAQSKFNGKHIFKQWHFDAFTKGSYSCPKPGDYTRFYGAQGLAELNNRLLFAGEHCSGNYSDYMNGAIETGLSIVQQLTSAK